jgi:predicted Zn-dependent protease
MSILDSKSVHRHRVVNPRAALIVVVVVVMFMFGTNKLHSLQFGKTVDFLRQSAYASLEARDYHKARTALNQYLAFRSSDMDAREKLSALLSTHIRTRSALEQAFHMNEEMLRNNLPQQELRLQQARIAVDLGRCSDAQAHLQMLQQLQADSAEVWYLSGHCVKEERKTAEAARCFQRSLDCKNPPEVAFEELASLAAVNPQLKLDAEAILDQMVTTCGTAEAFRIRAMRFVDRGKFSLALPQVWKGLQSAPDDVALNAILVTCLRSRDADNSMSQTTAMERIRPSDTETTRAIRHLQNCVERNPQQVSFRIQLAAMLWENKQQADAIKILESGIGRDSRDFSLYGVLIDYLLTLEQSKRAERLLEKLPAKTLANGELDLLSGRLQLLRKNWEPAEKLLQRAVAYSQPGSGLHQRAQTLLAVCRSNSGNATIAVDAFKTVLTADPNSVPGRLGMASAWIKSGRKDLAIAEYRQLLDVPGVAAFLADLIIQRNLEQPLGLRNWNEAAELVRDRNPYITDTTQRLLLQADLMMASGRITDAIASLEKARAANPANSSVERALARLSGERSGGLHDRLQQLANDSPDNHDILAALVRLELGASNAESALKLLETIASDQRNPRMDSVQSLALAIRTGERVVELEKHLGRTRYLEFFSDAACRYAYQLADLGTGREEMLARVLAQQGRAAEAFQRLRSLKPGTDPAFKASAIMALVQYASPRQSILRDAMQELVAMINATPESAALRICYADALLYDEHLDTASQVLVQIQNMPPHNGEVAARLAWILAVESGSLQKASDLIAHAIQRQPENFGFHVIEGRVLLAQKRYKDVLSVLNKLDAKHLSQAALTYKAAALLELDETGNAWQIAEQIRLREVRDPMFPADELLLQTIMNRLSQFTTAARTKP